MEQIRIVQDFLFHIPIFPFLWVPHCLMMSLVVRQVYGPGAVQYAKSNPLSCFVRTMIYTYPGGILSSLLMAEPAFGFLASTPTFLTMVTSWYLIFFSPRDFFAQFLIKSKLTFPCSMAQDFMRLQLCLNGVSSVAKTHPKALFYMTFMGMCKSSGFMVFKYVEHLLDLGLDKSKPFRVPNYPTKTCLIASLAFAIQACGLYDFGGNSAILAGLTLLAVTLRLFFYISTDPYEWFENWTCFILYGGNSVSLTAQEKASKKVI